MFEANDMYSTIHAASGMASPSIAASSLFLPYSGSPVPIAGR
jgi:hypothetical protein